MSNSSIAVQTMLLQYELKWFTSISFPPFFN